MGRKRIKNQHIIYRSVRITSNNDFLLDFVKQKNINLNRLIIKQLLSSPEYKVFKNRIDDNTSFLINTAFFND